MNILNYWDIQLSDTINECRVIHKTDKYVLLSDDTHCFYKDIKIANSGGNLIPSKDWNADDNHNYFICDNIKYS